MLMNLISYVWEIMSIRFSGGLNRGIKFMSSIFYIRYKKRFLTKTVKKICNRFLSIIINNVHMIETSLLFLTIPTLVTLGTYIRCYTGFFRRYLLSASEILFRKCITYTNGKQQVSLKNSPQRYCMIY